MLYRVYTEYLGQKGDQDIEQVVSRYFDSFTILHVQGIWNGQKELTTIIEIVADPVDSEIKTIAESIKKLNHQQAVLVQAMENQHWLI
jgi:hypothetical protein